MAKPYSMDLRERVAAAIIAGQGRRAVARRFEISLSAVGRRVQRFRERDTLAPDKFGGYKRHALAGEEQRQRDRIKERSDMTLAEIKEAPTQMTPPRRRNPKGQKLVCKTPHLSLEYAPFVTRTQ